MKKVVVACQKGGVGKSTLCLNLLVELVRKGHGAAVQDLDPQNSFKVMSDRRLAIHGNALPYSVGKPEADVVIVDTAPHADATLPAVIEDAALVLVPVRPAVLDLTAAKSTIDLVKKHGKEVAIVLTLSSPRALENQEAVAWAEQIGVPIAGIVHLRVDVSRAAGNGIGVSEYKKSSPANPEFEAIADYVLSKI